MENESKFGSFIIRLSIIAGAVITVAIGIYLFATSKPDECGKTVIRWVVDPNPIRKEQIKLFKSKHPNIRVINDPGVDTQRLLTQIAGDVPPDIMTLYDPQTLRLFAKNGVLLDLGPYIEKYKVPLNKLYPSLKPYVYYQNKIVGIPENCGPYVVFYNKKLFRKAGVPYPKSGWTWDECLNAAKKLTKYDLLNGRKIPVQKGIYISNSDWWFFVWMHYGHFYSKDGKKCLMDSEAVKKGIRYWADLRMKYHVMPTSSEAASMAPTGSWGSDALLFRESKVAMMVSGRFMSIQYREQKDLDWDVVSMPHGPNRVTLLASKSYAIPNSSRNKEEAVLFIRHLLSQDNQLLGANYGDGIPSIRDPEITKTFLYNPKFPKEKNNQLHIDEMKYARTQEYSPYINNLDVNAVMDVEMDKMWLGQQTADQTCNSIARQINAIIRRNIANPNFLN